jgi:hypothetical protein
MTPEIAELGIKRFTEVKDKEARVWSHKDYPDLSSMKVFQ